jgi:hypothetical protein
VSADVLAAIDAGLAELQRLVPVPTGALGYGSDLWCDTDLKPNVDELPGDSKTLLGQAVFHRIVTPRGSLPDDLEYGRDVRALLSKGLTAAGLAAEAAQLSNEITKDDRIATAEVVIQQLSLKELRITIALTGEDPEIGSFTLIVAVDGAGAWIEQVT